MIGVAGKDGRGAIELLGKHYAAKLMRPDHGAEADDEVGGGAQGGIVAIGSADDQRKAAPVLVAKASQNCSELVGREILAPLVEGDQHAALGQLRPEPGGLVMTPGFGRAGAPFSDFDDAAEVKAERRAAFAESLQIALRKVLLGAGLHPAYGQNSDLHSGASGGSVNRLFLEVGSLPHLFDVVEFPDFGTEDMDDDVAGIDQDPVGIGKALDPGLSEAGLLQRFD
jgi:hypothetical protein